MSLSGWTIANAGVTLPSGASIAGNGFYLITSSGTSASILSGSITPDFTTNSLVLNSVTQADLILKNASNITLDSAQASPWTDGSGATEVSMERENTPGDGLAAASWYSAGASVGFDTTVPKGTP